MTAPVPMDDSDPRSPNLVNLQVIVAAMAMGCLMLCGFAGYQHLAGNAPASTAGNQLLLAWLGLLPVQVVAWLVMREVLMKQAQQAWTQSKRDEAAIRGLLPRYVSYVIVRVAIIEGWALLGGTVFYLTGRWEVLAGPVLAVVLLLATMPTEAGLRGFFAKATGGEAH